ncbi:restriction endonuclease subunit S [Helicobacter sp. 23-1046]
MNLTNLEADFIAQGGKWEEFRIGDLFEVSGTTSLDENKIDFINEGINFVGRVNENNGVKGKIVKQTFEPNDKNTITATVIGNYKYVKYQKQPYYCSQNINKLTPKIQKWNEKIAYFFIANIQCFVSRYNGQQGGYKLDDIKNHKISLPTQSNQIAFDFMESYIKELEAERINEMEVERIQELEAYLEVTGLNDYELNAQEREALAIFASSLRASEASVAIHTTFCHTERSEVSHKNSDRDISAFSQPQYDNVNSPSRSTSGARGWVNPRNDALNLQWREFDFDKAFVYERGTRYKKADHTKGEIPYISSTALNNGIDNYVSPPDYMTIYENKLSLANSGSVGSCFYHPYKFVSSDHCMIIWTKDKELNRYIALFLSTIFEKLTKPKYEFAKEINDSRLRAEKIPLPVNQNNQIAFDFMETFISAVQKEVIKSVVLWNQKRINATKAIVENR